MFHLLRKDFSALRLWLGLTWATWALLLPHPFLATGSIDQTIVWLLLVNGAGWMMTLLTLARLVHLDPLTGSDQFLAVRPVSRRKLIGSKLLFTGLLLVLPLFAIRLLHVVLLGFHLGWEDYMLLLPGLLLPIIAAHLLLLLPAVFTRKTSGTVLILIGTAVLAFFLLVGYRQTAMQGGVPVNPEITQLTISRFYIAMGIFMACAAWAIVGFATSRRWTRPALAAVSAIALSLAALWYWPFNFVHALNTQGSAAPSIPLPNRDKLDLIHPHQVNNGRAWITGHQENNTHINTVAAPLVLRGLQAPWFARVESFASTARYEDGTVRNSYGAPYWTPEETAPLRTAAIKMLGLSTPPDALHGYFDNPNAPYDVFRQNADDWNRDKAQSPLVSIEGRLTFTVARPKILLDIPLRTKANATTGTTRYTIRQVSFYPERISLKLAVETARIPFRGHDAIIQERNTVYLVTNPAARLCYPIAEGGSGGFGGLGVYSLSERTFSVDIPAPVADPSLLRLSIVTAEAARKIDLPFRLSNGELPQ